LAAFILVVTTVRKKKDKEGEVPLQRGNDGREERETEGAGKNRE
jgi:hypothetical protein